MNKDTTTGVVILALCALGLYYGDSLAGWTMLGLALFALFVLLPIARELDYRDHD